MYIKWARFRKGKKGRLWWPGLPLYAYLVESQWKAGRVRKKTVAYLGSSKNPYRLAYKVNLLLQLFIGLGKRQSDRILRAIVKQCPSLEIQDGLLTYQGKMPGKFSIDILNQAKEWAKKLSSEEVKATPEDPVDFLKDFLPDVKLELPDVKLDLPDISGLDNSTHK